MNVREKKKIRLTDPAPWQRAFQRIRIEGTRHFQISRAALKLEDFGFKNRMLTAGRQVKGKSAESAAHEE
jgi:hypothetical protein